MVLPPLFIRLKHKTILSASQTFWTISKGLFHQDVSGSESVTYARCGAPYHAGAPTGGAPATEDEL
jgi:hypothetical protein